MADKNRSKKGGNGKDNRGGSVEGIIEIEGQSNLASEFITIGQSFEEALGRCVLRDDEQKNAIVIYKAQLEMFDLWEEIADLTNFLNASAAVGGYNRSLAAMTETGIYVAEGAGIKMGKESQKALIELQKIKTAQRDRENGDREQS